MNKEELIALLKQEVVPALGCTEPVCVALAAADAAKAAGGTILSVRVEMNPGIYKKGLKLLEDLSPAVSSQAINLVESGMVTLKLKEDEPLLYAHAEAVSSSGTGASTIRNTHSNIVCTARTVNGVLTPFFQKEYSLTGRTALHEKLASMTISQIVSLVESCSPKELCPGRLRHAAQTWHRSRLLPGKILPDRYYGKLPYEPYHDPYGQQRGRPHVRLSLCSHEQRRQRQPRPYHHTACSGNSPVSWL